MERAYREACRKETKRVYNARIILAGYSGGGKTSLAERLLGEKINVEERHSTEGIVLHHIESRFNRREMKGVRWDKKELNSEDLKKDFNLGLVAILQKGKRKASTDSSNTEEDSEPQETTTDVIKNEDIKAPKYPKISHMSENSVEKEEFLSLPGWKTIKEVKDLESEELEEDSEENTSFSISLWDLGGQD